jgi:hypothetical protein
MTDQERERSESSAKETGEEWETYNFHELRRYAKVLHISAGSNPDMKFLKRAISEALSIAKPMHQKIDKREAAIDSSKRKRSTPNETTTEWNGEVLNDNSSSSSSSSNSSSNSSRQQQQ